MGFRKLFNKIVNFGIQDEYEDEYIYEDIDTDGEQIISNFKTMMEERLKERQSRGHVQIRHEAEQNILPYIFYNHTKEFIKDLETIKEETVVNIMATPYEDRDEQPPYTKKDFKITKEQINRKISIIELELPQKHMSVGSCYRIYFVFDKKHRAKNYFTVEESIGQNQLCSIDIDDNRLNYGDIRSKLEEIDKIKSLI